MSKDSWAISEIIQELGSQKASLDDALRQLTLVHESFELQANQASEDICKAVAQQISELNQQKEQLLLQIEEICVVQGQQLKTKEENLRKAIAVLSAALDKIDSLSQRQTGEINQSELQQGMLQLFRTVKQTIESCGNLDQQNLCCLLNPMQLQEVIANFGEINIVGSKETEHEISGVLSSMKATANTILSSLLGVATHPWCGDNIQMWLADMQSVNVDLSPTEAVLQGLQRQSERQDLVWVLEQPVKSEESVFHNMSVAPGDCSDDNDVGEYWLLSESKTSDGPFSVKTKTELQKLHSSDIHSWLKSGGNLDIAVDQEQAVDSSFGSNNWRKKEDDLNQSNSYAIAIATGIQTHFSSSLKEWLKMPSKSSEDVNMLDENPRFLLQEMSTQQHPTEVIIAAHQTLELPAHSAWLTTSREFKNGGSSSDLDMWLASSNHRKLNSVSECNEDEVARAFERLRTEECDYTKWLSPNSTVESSVMPFEQIEQCCAPDQWLLSCQNATSVCPSGASLLDFANSVKLSQSHLCWLKKSGAIQKSLMASSPDSMSYVNTGQSLATEMAQALKRHDEMTADISQWLASPAESECVDSLKSAKFEVSSAKNISQWIVHGEWNKYTSDELSFCNKGKPFEYDDSSLWLYPQEYKLAASPTTPVDEFKNVKFWLNTKSTECFHVEVDPNDESIDLVSNATSQDFEIIDQFSKSSHSSLDETWLYQSEQ